MWSNILHGFGFGLSYTPMAVLAFSTMPTRYLTQGNAIFALIRMLGSSVFVSLILVVFAHSDAEANRQPGELDHPLHPRPDRALGDSASAISATATCRPGWPPRSSARPA